MWYVCSLERSQPSGKDEDEWELIEEAAPLLGHTASKKKDDQRSRGLLPQALSLLTFFQRALLVLFSLVACAGVLVRLRLSLAIFLVELGQSAVLPHRIVLLSAHLGPKFFGMQSLLALNKVRFAEMNNMPLYLAEDFYHQQSSGGELAVLQDFMRIKLQMALAVFAELGSATEWAIWVDGDAWLDERQVDLWKQLRLSETNGVDMLVGTEQPGMNSTADLPPCIGICTGVWAIRNSPSSIATLQRLLALSPAEYGKNLFDDQCAIEALWKIDPATRLHARVLDSADTGRNLQCRPHNKCTRYYPELCCSAESWNIQWPASDWHDLVERVVEEETGTDVLTRAIHSIEVDACNIASQVEGKPVPACREVISNSSS